MSFTLHCKPYIDDVSNYKAFFNDSAKPYFMFLLYTASTEKSAATTFEYDDPPEILITSENYDIRKHDDRTFSVIYKRDESFKTICK